MTDALKAIQCDLVVKLDEIAAICELYGYEVVPTIVLRHEDGAGHSMVLGNDTPAAVAAVVSELETTGDVSSQSPYEAMLERFWPGQG